MSDSQIPDNGKSKDLRRHWHRVQPAWRIVVAVGRGIGTLVKTLETANKVVQFFFWVTAAGGLSWAVWWNSAHEPPVAIQQETAKASDSKAAPTTAQAPLVLAPVDKPKPICVSVTPAKVKEALADRDNAASSYRAFKGRKLCGAWLMTVVGEVENMGNYWRATLTKDGLLVVVALRSMQPLSDGDIVEVGGRFGDYRLPGPFEIGGMPVIALQPGSITKR
jgi:hypothetical protein